MKFKNTQDYFMLTEVRIVVISKSGVGRNINVEEHEKSSEVLEMFYILIYMVVIRGLHM